MISCRRVALPFLAAVFALFVSSANSASRVALVIGNGDYRHSQPLANPANDARDFADMLEGMGFSVIRLFDGDFAATRESMRAFNLQVGDAEVALFYYAGHGMELGGENWLIPIDAELKTERDLAVEALSLKTIVQSVGRATKLGLVILDSCRDNPFAAKMTTSKLTRSVDRGLARVEPLQNVLVAYAAKDGTTAIDGTGRNSPYTAALLRHMPEAGVEVSFIFRKVRDTVLTATNRRQQPFVYGSLSSKAIYLRESGSAPAQAAATTSAPSAAQQATLTRADEDVWSTISRSSDETLFRSFVDRFPNSTHVRDAKERLQVLQAAAHCLGSDVATAERARSTFGECEKAIAGDPGNLRLVVKGAQAAETSRAYSKARELYARAAEQGNTVAMLRLGSLYESNLAGPPDYERSRSLYVQAADRKEARAATRLGHLYEDGKGLERSYAKARFWYKVAAQLGDREAMSRLALIYERGLGGPKDKAEARSWREKASERAPKAAADPAR